MQSILLCILTYIYSLEEDFRELSGLLINAECRHVLVKLEVSKPLEDLLQSRLTHGVVLKLMLLLQLLNQLEQEANGLVVALDSKTHVATVVLDHLNIDELLTEALNHTEESTFDKDILSDLIERKLLP